MWKITTKSQIETRLPEQMPHRITNADCYSVRPNIAKPHVVCRYSWISSYFVGRFRLPIITSFIICDSCKFILSFGSVCIAFFIVLSASSVSPLIRYASARLPIKPALKVSSDKACHLQPLFLFLNANILSLILLQHLGFPF